MILSLAVIRAPCHEAVMSRCLALPGPDPRCSPTGSCGAELTLHIQTSECRDLLIPVPVQGCGDSVSGPVQDILDILQSTNVQFQSVWM